MVNITEFINRFEDYSLQNFFSHETIELKGLGARISFVLTRVSTLLPGLSLFGGAILLVTAIQDLNRRGATPSVKADFMVAIVIVLGLGLLLLLLGTLICLGRGLGQLVCGRNRNNSVFAEN